MDREREWLAQFQIQSTVELDLIYQNFDWPIGMTRASPPEFRQRLLAAAISYRLGLRSIDQTLKQYVKPDTYEVDADSLGDMASDFLRVSLVTLKGELRKLHTQEGLTFGIFGAELTLFKLPETLDVARVLANRGLLLEVLPILRLRLEMTAWSAIAFYIDDEKKVINLKAQTCIAKIRSVYESYQSA
jgi:hypothetical protein